MLIALTENLQSRLSEKKINVKMNIIWGHCSYMLMGILAPMLLISLNKNQTLEGQLKKLRQELKKLPELEEKIKQLEESQKPVNVNAPSPGTNTNIEGQNLQQESILVESNLGRHSPPPSSSNEQPEVKKQKLEKVEEANLGAIAEAKQIGHGIAAVTPPPSSNP